MPANVGVLLTRSQLDTIDRPRGLSAYRMAAVASRAMICAPGTLLSSPRHSMRDAVFLNAG
jgi:hypothetical protein